MATIDQNSFKSPIIGFDPVTKGKFIIETAHILLDYDWDEEEVKNTRASGSILIDGWDNPLFEAVKEHPLRIQGLVASVMFGTEKKFIRFSQITDYDIVDDGIVKEIGLVLIFDVLDNLEYMENIIIYKDEHQI
jgi:hypothetical protein